MCGGVQFDRDGKTIKTFFPNPKSQLPLLTRQGQTIMVPWGRREQQPGQTPLIQGLIATDGPFNRLYVITEENEKSCHIKQRWPRLLQDPNLPAASDRLL